MGALHTGHTLTDEGHFLVQVPDSGSRWVLDEVS